MFENIILQRKVQKIKNTPVGITFYNIINDPPHQHENCLEILYCIKGTATIISADQRVTMHESDIFTIDAMDIHSLSSDDASNLIIVLHIDLTDIDLSYEYLQYIFFTCRSDHCSSFQEKNMYAIKDCILTMAYIYSSKDQYEADTTATYYASLANKVIDIMLTNFDWFDFMNTYPNTNKISRERFNRISSFCQQNYMNKITLNGIARQEYINENYLSQFMIKSPFRSFSNMLNYIRCYQSELLLLKTELSNTEISYKCGFSDPKYFYRHFRKWYFHTPSEHRKWYVDRASIPQNYEIIPPDNAFFYLEKYISKYHVNKAIVLEGLL